MIKMFFFVPVFLAVTGQCLAEGKVLIDGKTVYGHEVGSDKIKNWVEYFDVNGDGYYKNSTEFKKLKWWGEGNKLCEKGPSLSDTSSCELLRINGDVIEVLDVKTEKVLSVIDKIVDGDAENLREKWQD